MTLVLTDNDSNGGGDDVKTGGGTPGKPQPLPPLRKFAVHRLNDRGSKTETIIVTGHALEPIGTQGIAIVEFRAAGDKIVQTYPRIFNEWRDIEELETNTLKIN